MWKKLKVITFMPFSKTLRKKRVKIRLFDLVLNKKKILLPKMNANTIMSDFTSLISRAKH